MLVVDEAMRGRGVGEKLVRAAERVIADAGCGLVEVTSNLARAKAHGFYERLGYARTSLRFAREPRSAGAQTKTGPQTRPRS
jgi:ribosomal protein S18 acetylase RimI-like enzyme